MLESLQVAAVLLGAVALAPALAHALELPGKMRLSKDAYFAVQTIYYPGFTVAGVAEPLGAATSLAILTLAPVASADFQLTLVALLGFAAMQAVYWLLIHPVNKVWLRGERLGGVASSFFSVASAGAPRPVRWERVRDRWEYSHAARAGLAALSFTALVIALR